MATRRQFQNISEDGTFIGTVVGHLSAFQHVIQYFGNYLEARVWPGSTCNPQIGDKVTVKPYPRAGYNLIVSGINHSPGNVSFATIFKLSRSGSSIASRRISFLAGTSTWNKSEDVADFSEILTEDPDGTSTPTQLQIFPYNKDIHFLLFKSAVDSYGAYDYTAPYQQDSPGRILAYRTEDRGKTFTELSYPTNWRPRMLARDINGRLWMISHRVDITPSTDLRENSVWYSDDLGDNWTLSLHNIGDNELPVIDLDRFCQIATHPTDANQICILSWNFNTGSERPKIFYTTDGGSSWSSVLLNTTNSFNGGGSEDWFTLADHLWLPSGRLFWYGLNNGSNANVTNYIIYSDDLATWHRVYEPYFDSNTETQQYPEQVLALIRYMDADEDGSVIRLLLWQGDAITFFLGGPRPPYTSEIWTSLDQGITWSRTINSLSTPATIGGARGHVPIPDSYFAHSGAYDSIADSLILPFDTIHNMHGSQDNPVSQLEIFELQPIRSEQYLYDMTNHLTPDEEGSFGITVKPQSGVIVAAHNIRLFPY